MTEKPSLQLLMLTSASSGAWTTDRTNQLTYLDSKQNRNQSLHPSRKGREHVISCSLTLTFCVIFDCERLLKMKAIFSWMFSGGSTILSVWSVATSSVSIFVVFMEGWKYNAPLEQLRCDWEILDGRSAASARKRGLTLKT